MLMPSRIETNFGVFKYLGKAINIKNFIKHFLNSITDTQS